MKCNRQFQVAVVLLVVSGFVLAQEKTTPTTGKEAAKAAVGGSGSTALGVRQDRVKSLVLVLTEKFKKLAKSKTIEPEQAERLIKALNKAAESQLENRLVAVIALLNDSQLSRAADEQKDIITELKQLIEILTEDEDEREQEEERLQQWRDQVKDLIKQEADIEKETDKVSDKDKTLDNLDDQIKTLEDLIGKQKEVIKKTAASRKQGIQTLDGVADQQRELRSETKKLAKAVAGDKSEQNADEQKPGEGKPGKDKPGEGKPGGQQGSPQPGQKPLEKAVENQKKAEDHLGKGKGKAAEKDEHKTLANLNQAMAELKKERNRIATLPPEALDSLAEQQDKTANKTGELKKQMAEASQAAGQPGGEPGGEPGQQPFQPGQQKIQQAQKQMQQASGSLKKKAPKKALPKEKKAVKNLEEALDEIERRLAQLREEMRADRLAKLEAHFRQMLAIQEPITAATVEMERLRGGGNQDRKHNRKDRIRIRRLGDQENQLAILAQKALDILVEDGTSTVFPHVVEQLREDLYSTASLLGDFKTGSYTQAMQREIEQTLKELIEALEEAQKQAEENAPPPPGQSPPPSDKQPPLLPDSAELKLLRSAQLRVNRRTKSFDDIRPDGELDGVLKREMVKIAAQQENVFEMTLEMVERN